MVYVIFFDNYDNVIRLNFHSEFCKQHTFANNTFTTNIIKQDKMYHWNKDYSQFLNEHV